MLFVVYLTSEIRCIDTVCDTESGSMYSTWCWHGALPHLSVEKPSVIVHAHNWLVMFWKGHPHSLVHTCPTSCENEPWRLVSPQTTAVACTVHGSWICITQVRLMMLVRKVCFRHDEIIYTHLHNAVYIMRGCPLLDGIDQLMNLLQSIIRHLCQHVAPIWHMHASEWCDMLAQVSYDAAWQIYKLVVDI